MKSDLMPFNPALVNQGDFVAVYSETREEWNVYRYVCMYGNGIVVESTLGASRGMLFKFPRAYVLCLRALPPATQAPNQPDDSDNFKVTE